MRLALMHLDTLSAEIDLWNLEHPTKLTPELSEDQHTVSFAYTELSNPPLMQWSARFGSALTDLRSALDSLTWQVAHLDGTKPAKPKQLYFPILSENNAKGWKDWQKIVPDLAAGYLARFREVGTLLEGEVGNWLSILSRLNNVDKHQSSLVLSPYSASGQLSLNLDLGGPRSEGTTASFRPILNPTSPMKVGDTILEVAWSLPFQSAIGDAHIDLTPCVRISREDEEPIFMPTVLVLNALHDYVQLAVSYICTGTTD